MMMVGNETNINLDTNENVINYDNYIEDPNDIMHQEFFQKLREESFESI